MAQWNITLDQEEIMRLLANDSGDGFRRLLQKSLDAVLAAESAEQLRAAPYERSGERTDVRNGSRTRPLTTRIGTIELQVPLLARLVHAPLDRSRGELVANRGQAAV